MNELKELIKVYKQKDPSATSALLILLTYPGLHATFLYKISNKLWKRKLFFVARIISQIARAITGIEIHPGATIGKRLFIDHGMGIVIGETAIIGNDVMIFHQVTLGGTGKQTGRRHPIIEDNVMISAGAKIIGRVVVGENSKVGANAVILGDVPKDATVVGCPAYIVRLNGEKVNISIKSKTNVRDSKNYNK